MNDRSSDSSTSRGQFLQNFAVLMLMMLTSTLASLALADGDSVQFRNLWIKELK